MFERSIAASEFYIMLADGKQAYSFREIMVKLDVDEQTVLDLVEYFKDYVNTKFIEAMEGPSDTYVMIKSKE